MNILILTAFTKKVVWNNYGNCDFGKFCAEVNLKYANKHNYSFVCEISETGLSDRQNTWLKIPFIKKHLPNYDYVVWIDADAIFLKNTKIEDFIDDGIDLVISKNPPSESDKRMYTMTSTGFMIWKNSQWSIDTLNYIWDNSGKYNYEFFHEQTVMDLFIRQTLTDDNLLNMEYFDITKPVVTNNIKIIPYRYHFLSENTLFVYHAGSDTPTKYKRLLNAYTREQNNKLSVLFQYGNAIHYDLDSSGIYTTEIYGINDYEEVLLHSINDHAFNMTPICTSSYIIFDGILKYSHFKLRIFNEKEDHFCFRKVNL